MQLGKTVHFDINICKVSKIRQLGEFDSYSASLDV